jgi:pyruvate formate lyase activating enzyme
LREIARRIYDEVNPETPWHVSRYFPHYKFTRPPTSIHLLEKAYNIGKEAGLKFVYIGNVPGHKYENTYCPSCGELLIERKSFALRKYKITHNKRCPSCGNLIPIIGNVGKLIS